jgi:F-type H+-transporting ATPase subunit epsilon
MKLQLTSLDGTSFEVDDVVALQAEDASGSFGILARHADFLTVLATSVLSWRLADGRTRCCAVHGGILTVRAGTVRVATREAVLADELDQLASAALARFRERDAAANAAQTQALGVEFQAVRALLRYLRPDEARLA